MYITARHTQRHTHNVHLEHVTHRDIHIMYYTRPPDLLKHTRKRTLTARHTQRPPDLLKHTLTARHTQRPPDLLKHTHNVQHVTHRDRQTATCTHMSQVTVSETARLAKTYT